MGKLLDYTRVHPIENSRLLLNNKCAKVFLTFQRKSQARINLKAFKKYHKVSPNIVFQYLIIYSCGLSVW